MTNNVVRLQQQSRVFATPVLPSDLDQFLPSVRRLLGKAVKRHERNVGMEDIISDLYAGRSALWLVYIGDTLVAAITTSIVRHPRRKVLFIEFVGGTRMKEWMEYVLNMLTHVAKETGLEAIEADGRDGFKWHCKRQDAFKAVSTRYEMEL